MTRNLRLLALVGYLSSLLGCGRNVPPRPMTAVPLVAVAQPGSGEPSLAVGPDGQFLLSWIEPAGAARHALRYSTRAAGQAWSEPRTIAEGSDWFVNWADVPSVAVLADGTLFAHWLEKNAAASYAYNVRVTTSRDSGKTWSIPVVPHRDGTKTEHGFVSMTAWNKDAMGLVWLDGRKTAGSTHEGHGMQAEMSLMHTTLSADGRLGEETVLDGRVCDCCQTDAVRVGSETVIVYRDRSDREVRDMSVVRFASGRWSSPQTLARDEWEINGCPVNGPAIAASGETVAVAWFTAPNEKARVNVAFSFDSGKTFGPPVVVDDGRPLGRVDVVVVGERAIVSWLEQIQGGAALRLRSVARDGSSGSALTIADSSAARSSGFPRIAEARGEIVVAWRDTSDPPVVRTAVVTGMEQP